MRATSGHFPSELDPVLVNVRPAAVEREVGPTTLYVEVEVDESADLTPGEARQLAAALLNAADTVDAVSARVSA